MTWRSNWRPAVIAVAIMALILAAKADAHVINWGCCWITWEGHKHSDVVQGSAGASVLKGRGGNDWIQGRGGRDYLVGGLGADFLNGGPGIDTCIVTQRDRVHSCEQIGGVK